MTDPIWLERGDPDDPEIRRIIERQTREASKHLRDLFHRYRKADFEGQINAVTNTVGIMVAEIIRAGNAADPEFGRALATVIEKHIENALTTPRGGPLN
jgi:phytoene/squalene synthetase